MEAHEIIGEQISAAIAALVKAKGMLRSNDIDQHLDIAAFHISDIQFNVNSLRYLETIHA
ncbi:MAG: hypothetical protein WC208_11915 [Gallionella sp.]